MRNDSLETKIDPFAFYLPVIQSLRVNFKKNFKIRGRWTKLESVEVLSPANKVEN